MEPIYVVTGFGRCGSTLVMRMLHAGGVPVLADNLVDFELDSTLDLPTSAAWLEHAPGRALKVLDPLRHRLPRRSDYRFLWLDRDHRQQAHSAVKLMESAGLPRMPRAKVRELGASFARDMGPSLALLRSYGAPVFRLRFEDLVGLPVLQRALDVLEIFVGRDLDRTAAEREVVARDPRCARGLLEGTLPSHAPMPGDRVGARSAAS